MCAFGSCRVEWKKREDKTSGPRKYCKLHSDLMFKVSLKKAQLAYRKRIPDKIKARGVLYRDTQKAYRFELFGLELNGTSIREVYNLG